MPEFATYKNKHTEKVAKYLRLEIVPNYPNPITVHILLIDGKECRRNDESFLPHWDLVGWYA